jgi:hypothetical protein
LAAAAVEVYLRCDDHKLLQQMEGVHNFSVDLLKAVKTTLNTLKYGGDGNRIIVKDPITGRDLYFEWN